MPDSERQDCSIHSSISEALQLGKEEHKVLHVASQGHLVQHPVEHAQHQHQANAQLQVQAYAEFQVQRLEGWREQIDKGDTIPITLDLGQTSVAVLEPQMQKRHHWKLEPASKVSALLKHSCMPAD